MERRLSAILAADVAGYSGLMEADEAGTFERLRGYQKDLFEPEIARHRGRIFKLMGDGLMAEFGSVSDSVECAAAIQDSLAKRNASLDDEQRINLRIGINLGEVIVDGDDRFGTASILRRGCSSLPSPAAFSCPGRLPRRSTGSFPSCFSPWANRK
jgi:adenylate cyclase